MSENGNTGQRKFNVVDSLKLETGEVLALLAPDGVLTKFTVAIVKQTGSKVTLSHINDDDDKERARKIYFRRAAFDGRNAYQN